MSHLLIGLTFIVFSWCVPGSSAWAQTALFAATPSPLPAFLSDHSYDNTDVDGTSLKPEKKTDGSDDLEPLPPDPNAEKDLGPDSASAKTKKEAATNAAPTPTREPDINSL
jgi:hypothetical protein